MYKSRAEIKSSLKIFYILLAIRIILNSYLRIIYSRIVLELLILNLIINYKV